MKEMKKKMSNILIYADNKIKIYDTVEVEVDDYGEEWLSPEKIAYLELIHQIILNTCDNSLKSLEKQNKIIVHSQSPDIKFETNDSHSGELPSALNTYFSLA